MTNEKIKNAVKARYSQIAEWREQSCCSSCWCGISPLVLSSREFYVEDSNNNEMVKLSSITIRAYKPE